MDQSNDLGLHPRLAQAHTEFHGSHAYRQAILMVDSGHTASAIPPANRSGLKTLIEQLLMHYHDLGFSAGYSGVQDPDRALAHCDANEGQILRQRVEGQLGRIQEDLRRHFRDSELKWKKADPRDAQKSELAAQMSRYRQEATRVMAIDKGTLIARVHSIACEAFLEGHRHGFGIFLSNQRKHRLGLPMDEIEIMVQTLPTDNDIHA